MRLPPIGARGLQRTQMRGPVVGVGVLRASVGVMGDRGAEEIKVDAVHGFRPRLDFPLVMP